MTRAQRVLVLHRSRHHAQGNGHTGGAELLDADVLVDGTGPSVPYTVAHLASRAALGDEYGSLGFQREVEAFRVGRGDRSRPASIHFLSAEHDAYHLPRIARRFGWHTSAWFHRPPAALEQLLDRRSGLARLDRAWAVASNQLPVLEARFGPDRVGLMRLGVDLERFTPGAGGRRDRSVLFLGTHLRDVAQLRRVFRRLAALDPTIDRRVVVPGPTPDVDGVPATIRIGVSDADLVSELRRAGVVFLPLSESTANLSLLEALACGAPIVATGVGGVAEYAGDAAVLVGPGDDDAAVEAIRAMLDDDAEAGRRQELSRRRAMDHSWAKVSEAFRWSGSGVGVGPAAGATASQL